jgi:hypothetical protein
VTHVVVRGTVFILQYTVYSSFYYLTVLYRCIQICMEYCLSNGISSRMSNQYFERVRNQQPKLYKNRQQCVGSSPVNSTCSLLHVIVCKQEERLTN